MKTAVFVRVTARWQALTRHLRGACDGFAPLAQSSNLHGWKAWT